MKAVNSGVRGLAALAAALVVPCAGFAHTGADGAAGFNRLSEPALRGVLAATGGAMVLAGFAIMLWSPG